MKRKENTANNSKEYAKVDNFKVTNVHTFGNDDTIGFNLTINAVTIYNCVVVEGKNGDFISFPSRKGNDGKYYSYAYISLSDTDSKAILNAVEAELNK